MGTRVDVSKVSSKVLEDTSADPVQKIRTKSVLEYLKQSTTSYAKIYLKNLYQTKGQVKAYYRFAESGNLEYGLPTFTAEGIKYDFATVKTAIDTLLSIDSVIIDAYKEVIIDRIAIGTYLQDTVEAYQPYLNTLSNGAYHDWLFDTYEVSYDDFTDTTTYSISIIRYHKDNLIWIEGLDEITAGNTAKFTVHSAARIPKNCSVTVALTYSGTLAGTQYTAINTVTLTELQRSVEVEIPISADPAQTQDDTLIVSLSTLTDVDATFQSLTARSGKDTFTTIVQPYSGIRLALDDQTLPDTVTTITVPVTLIEAAAGAFTVDYAFIDGAATSVEDYNGTGGTLSFTGAADEVQNIVIPVTPTITDGAIEDFSIQLSNCSDPTVDITDTATIKLRSSIPEQLVLTYTEQIDSITLTDPALSYVGPQLLVKYRQATDLDIQWYYKIFDRAEEQSAGIVSDTYNISMPDMLPVVIARKQKQSITELKGTTRYQSIRNLVRRLAMDIDDVVDNLEDNADIADVDDGFINFAICPKDNHPLLSKILWNHFDRLVTDLANSAPQGWLAPSSRYITTFVEEDVNNTSKWQSHTKENNLPGVKTTLGEYIHEIIDESFTYWDDNKGANGEYVTIIDRQLKIYYQATSTSYHAISIKNLTANSTISYAGKTRTVSHDLANNSLTIPLTYDAVKDLSAEEIVQIYKYILRFDIYAIRITHLSWYETSFFRGLFTFVAIAITIYTLGTSTSILAAIQTLVVDIAITQLVIYIAKETGNMELAAIVGVIAYVALGNIGMSDPFSFATAADVSLSMSKFSNVLTASETGAVQRVQEELDDVQDDIDQLEEQVDNYGGVTPEFMLGLIRSPAASDYLAIQRQYDFDSLLTGSYDRLVYNYHSSLLSTGFEDF